MAKGKWCSSSKTHEPEELTEWCAGNANPNNVSLGCRLHSISRFLLKLASIYRIIEDKDNRNLKAIQTGETGVITKMLSVTGDRIKRWLFYAGLEKNEFEEIQENYHSSNCVMLRIMSVGCGILCIAYGIYSIIAEQKSDITLSCILTGAANMIIACLIMQGRPNRRKNYILTKLFVWLDYCFGIYIGTVCMPDSLAVLFIVSIVILPTMFTDRPITLLAEMIIAMLLFSLSTLANKTPELALNDIVNAVVFGVASIMLNCYMHNVKIKGYLAENNNKKASLKLKENNDIIASANMGVWSITLFDGEKPSLKVNATMRELLSLPDYMTDETEIYDAWYSRIKPESLPSVLASIEAMKNGRRDENTYLWIDPVRGEQYVRCGGIAKLVKNKGYVLQGYHYNVNDEVLRDQHRELELKNTLEVVEEQFAVLKSMSQIYHTMHLIDLEKNSEKEFNESSDISEIAKHSKNATEMMRAVIGAKTSEQYREKALEFTELTTVRERMGTKKIISEEFIGNALGWFRAQFVQIESDEHGMARKVMFTTQGVDEEKRRSETLLKQSYTDGLTGLYNRRAYEEELTRYREGSIEEDFVYISVDVNGLKAVNDTIGHVAGDELLTGTSRCMRTAFGDIGRIYRIGGDEFVCMALAKEAEIKKAAALFEEENARWSGEYVKNLSVAYGMVARRELPGASIDEIAIIADQRLYLAKREYYKKAGNDRRQSR